MVYGEIGSSPHNAFREAMSVVGNVNREAVLGMPSLILWELMVILTAQYSWILLRADNQGEGRTLSFLSLEQRAI